jgi:hypothetical protein
MAMKKIKIDEEVISEILVADADLESDTEASEEEEEEEEDGGGGGGEEGEAGGGGEE